MAACGKNAIAAFDSEEVTIAEMKNSMVDYCLNALRKRTIDEQLVDFSDLMKSTLVQRVEYRRTGLNVSYTVGPLSASVDGSDESTCVRQCKLDILHELKSFCSYIDRRVTQTVLPSDSLAREVQEVTVGGKTATTRDTVLVAPGLVIPEELRDFMADTKSPLVLEVSQFPAEREINYAIGPYTARGSVKPSMCMEQCKTLLLHELRAWIGVDKVRAGKNAVGREAVADVPPTVSHETNKVSENGLVGENQRCDRISRTDGPAIIKPTAAAAKRTETTSRTAVSADLPGTGRNQQPTNRSLDTPEQYVDRTSEVLRNVSRNAFRQSANRFFHNLVHAFLAGRPYLKRITDCIVSNAIDNPDNCAVYAELCCYAIGKAWEDSTVTVRQGMANAFKVDLIKSCRDVLTKAGLSTVVTSGRRARNAGQSERSDPKARERTHATCRLMGELFMRDLIFKTVMCAAEAFMETHNAHSLECLCILLTIIAPKLEKAIDDPRRLYEQLDSYSAAGYAGDIPLPRRTVQMIDAALNVQKYYAAGRRGVYTARETDERDRCSRPAVTGSPDHHRAADRRTAPLKGILRRDQSRPPSGAGAEPTQHRKKRVTFNPRTSILCFPRNR